MNTSSSSHAITIQELESSPEDLVLFMGDTTGESMALYEAINGLKAGGESDTGN